MGFDDEAFIRWDEIRHFVCPDHVLLLDVGLPLRWHRALFALALVLALALFWALWSWRWY